MKVGEISEPIETRAGIHIIRLGETGSIRYKPYKKAATEVEEGLYQEKYDDALAKWLKGIRDAAYVEVRL